MPYYKASVRKATPISDAASYFSKNYFERQSAAAEQALVASSSYGGYQAIHPETTAHASTAQASKKG